MRFLFRQENVGPNNWKIKEDIIKAYFELCKATGQEDPQND